MNLIVKIIKKIKNLIPYFLLIAMYFFFINLETMEEQKNKSNIKSESQDNEKKSRLEDKKQIKISIPVLPYRK